ncbi:hypothetical protein [Gloeobacter kilaueensis]|uniref:Uncharacterized protein n=1 Tax=Gloeobacter kilaueensis (strain ATCC BAA-2537 / CCAP 1431/1 / ULC 316 / JS1) TaxID=1183438 RepID=U5QP41_GLOK1|nr:hypothetical protein [Gloeobacter kilaueensis]AGY60716.1 hypothetical protein GKIL_4470 [Gloeobacter kilaueensis JS1]
MTQLQDLLSDQQYRTVLKAASRAQDERQLPLVAWALGFVSLTELAAVLETANRSQNAPTPRP